jgi:transposase
MDAYRLDLRFGSQDGFASRLQWIGAIGVQLASLAPALQEGVLSRRALHADETLVAMLEPADLRDGKTLRAYLWSYCITA